MTDSVLKMENLYFSHFDFHREEEIRQYENDEIKLGFGKKTLYENGNMTLNIMLQAVLEDAFELRLTATGVFSCTSEDIQVESFEKMPCP